MKIEEISENRVVYWWWRCGVVRGVVRAIADNRVVVQHIQRVEDGRLLSIPDVPAVMFLPPEDLQPNSWMVSPPR